MKQESLTLVPRSLLLNRTETLAAQASLYIVSALNNLTEIMQQNMFPVKPMVVKLNITRLLQVS